MSSTGCVRRRLQRDAAPHSRWPPSACEAMGPLARSERIMLASSRSCCCCGCRANGTACRRRRSRCLGLALLLLTRVLDWQDVLDEKGAWDALIWFGGLVMLAAQLDKAGLPRAFAGAAAAVVGGWPWWWALVALLVVYLYCALRVRQPGGARHRDVSGVLRGGDRPRRAAARRRARASGSSPASTPRRRTTAPARRRSCSAPAT